MYYFYLNFVVSYTIFSSYVFIVDLFFQNLKLDKNSPQEIVNKYSALFPNVFKNVVIHTIPLFIWIEYIYYDYQYQLTILTFVFQFIVSIISSQFLFYWAHRMMHTKYLKKYHNVHHEVIIPIGISALYAHPIDAYIGNILPMGITPIILGFHPITINILITYMLFLTIILGHSNIIGFTKTHGLHHKYKQYNYGNSAIDKMFGTYASLHFLQNKSNSSKKNN